MSFARTLDPPYYAVIFTTMRVNNSNDGYAEMSERLEKMVCGQPGVILAGNLLGRMMGMELQYATVLMKCP